jgi:rfaE bifunctional protein nucleotidyltransferase chain/domain
LKPITVFTNGCFDILHAGHIRLLEQAKSLGDFLLVGLNSDSSVRRLKGPDRPRFPLKLRAEVLSALVYIDFIIPFSEDTPEKLIREIEPDIMVKGEEWQGEDLAGAEFVRSYGGVVVFARRTLEISTTKILKGGKQNG